VAPTGCEGQQQDIESGYQKQNPETQVKSQVTAQKGESVRKKGNIRRAGVRSVLSQARKMPAASEATMVKTGPSGVNHPPLRAAPARSAPAKPPAESPGAAKKKCLYHGSTFVLMVPVILRSVICDIMSMIKTLKRTCATRKPTTAEIPSSTSASSHESHMPQPNDPEAFRSEPHQVSNILIFEQDEGCGGCVMTTRSTKRTRPSIRSCGVRRLIRRPLRL
jgi:hypothetical protein